MPEAIEKYRCSLCKEEYNSLQEASVCETLGSPTNEPDGSKSVGDDLTWDWDNEDGTFLSVRTQKSGRIISRQIILVTPRDGSATLHGHLYVVEIPLQLDSDKKHEEACSWECRGVYYSKEYGYVSPAGLYLGVMNSPGFKKFLEDVWRGVKSK